MGRKLRTFFLAALLALPLGAGAASYESQLEQGLFYLGRGPTYAPEAVRALEAARALDPEKAVGDGRLLGGLARAYAITARYSEAFWLLEELEGSAALSPEDAALRQRLLGESGLGRVRLLCAVPLSGLTARVEPAEGTRLEATSRRTLERLGELLARGVDPGPEGVVLLAPEGVYRLGFDSPELEAPSGSAELEVWAGDEVALRLVPRYPSPEGWTVEARSRSVTLSWAALEGASFRLFRRAGDDGEAKLVYRGAEDRYADTGLPVGARVEYRLETLADRGELLAVSEVTARTLPPVAALSSEAILAEDLHVRIRWQLGDGAADRVRVVREDPEGDVVVGEAGAPEPVFQGQVRDGPFAPRQAPRRVAFRVEAWVDGEAEPSASGRAEVEIPPLVFKVAGVTESIERGGVVVSWETLPRDAAADGYAVFRQRGQGVEGELVARVEGPFVREFEYPVEDPLAAAGWRHSVLPYVGDRYILDPDRMEFRGTEPDSGLDRRHRMGQKIPDMGLSWAPYPGARGYVVTLGEQEVRVNRPYVEASGLQSPLMGTSNHVAVFALDGTGRRVPLLTVEVNYEHYPRPSSGLEGGERP